MFDTIILLTGQVEQMPLGAVLRGHNPQLTVHPALTLGDLAAFDTAMLSRSRLIAFATPVIVPAGILASLGHGAYNFHPGPPQYPGWAPAHFALYEQATEFGATVHAMA
jgi:methionyl-tRNA formyltransferase